MKKYINPEIDILSLNIMDVITTSGNSIIPDEVSDPGVEAVSSWGNALGLG